MGCILIIYIIKFVIFVIYHYEFILLYEFVYCCYVLVILLNKRPM